MNRYIGIDAHDKSCTAVVLDQRGHEMKHAVLETNGQAIREFIEQVPGDRHVAFEEGNLSGWLYELIEPLSARVVVFMPEKRSGPKDDLRDARAAAEGLRIGGLARTVFKPGRELADLRSAVRGHQIFRQDLTRAKVRLNAIFRSRAAFPSDAIYDKKLRPAELKLLPPAEQRLAKVLGDEVDSLQELSDEQIRVLRKYARTPEVRRLETLPGIGLIRAATIVAVVGTPHRFRKRGQFLSYCGLGIVEWTSSDWARGAHGAMERVVKNRHTRGLNRNRNAALKEVFKGAATTLVGSHSDDPHAEAHRRRVAGGLEPNLSMLTLTRQLATIALAMWKNEEDYDPSRYSRNKTTDP